MNLMSNEFCLSHVSLAIRISSKYYFPNNSIKFSFQLLSVWRLLGMCAWWDSRINPVVCANISMHKSMASSSFNFPPFSFLGFAIFLEQHGNNMQWHILCCVVLICCAYLGWQSIVIFPHETWSWTIWFWDHKNQVGFMNEKLNKE